MCFFSLAEAAENAEKDEIEYLHQNRRKICSDETTHPTGKVTPNVIVETKPSYLLLFSLSITMKNYPPSAL
jgi:hypothetical protein